MVFDRPADLSALQKHLSEYGIPLITPSDPSFEATRACFAKREAAVPLAIARPQNAEHVQTLVRYCTQNGVDFVVRSGGHDCAGRSQVKGALTIDMRDIKDIHVSADEKTATLGGGILFRDLAKELDSRELVTPV
jgi:FAD/FMN-containing dehydrogenase